MRTNYPRHLTGFSYVGLHRYSLTFCTLDRRNVFVQQEPVDLVTSQFLRAARELRFDLVAYCFMPDHVHLIAEGTREDADLKRFVSLATQLSGHHYARCLGRTLWQRYGYEHVLRDDESTQAAVRYILENPVRAGLVDAIEKYPFWGSSVYSRQELIEFAYEVGPAEAGHYER